MKNSVNKINIVLLTDCLADLMGGAERQIYELARSLDKGKFAVTIASLECVGQAPRHVIEEAGCQFIDFRVKRIYGLSGIIQGFRFWRFLKRNNIHIVQTYHFSSDIWGTLIAHFAGIKHIISNRRDMGFWKTQRHIKAYRWVNPWVSKIVVVSESIKQAVISMENVPEEKIQVIYNGITLEKSQPDENIEHLKKKNGISENTIIIMHVANLTPVKGHDYLLRAMAKLQPDHPGTQLVLIGDGPLRKPLTDLTNELKLSNTVTFLGKREDARKLLSLADICVLPSLSEGMSNSILEYMAAGKPVIATKVGGNPELVINKQTGLLVSPENVIELCNALLLLIKTPEKRSEFGQRGLAQVQSQFSMPKMIKTYEQLFTGIAQKKTMNILHLVSSNGLFGAERVILNLAKCEGMNSYVGALRNLHNPHLEIIDEAKKMKLQTAVFDSHGRFDWKTVFKIKNFLKANHIDILHTHNYKSDIVGFAAAKCSGTKWMATNHVWHGTDQKLKFYEKLDAFILKFASRVVAVSDEIKENLIAKNFKKERLRVIDNGIDLSLFHKNGTASLLKAELNIPENNPVVTIIGRLSKEKGHAVFLQAAKKVLKEKNNVRFLIVGDGPLKEELQNEANHQSLNSRVIFTGIRQDMPDVYAASDIFVNASYIEGLPMTILEAMASKVPLIVTPVGAVPHVIRHNTNGIIVPTGDSDQLAKEICALIDQPDLRQNLVNRAYEDVRTKYSFETMAGCYKNTYREVLTQCEGKHTL